mmetsp:Transcript_9096/g.20366  ORF Transcript_9096/g.20366 Transcript_9096/m.20366 type:complete len:563 (-) Transcript_9096:242-1930(-)
MTSVIKLYHTKGATGTRPGDHKQVIITRGPQARPSACPHSSDDRLVACGDSWVERRGLLAQGPPAWDSAPCVVYHPTLEAAQRACSALATRRWCSGVVDIGRPHGLKQKQDRCGDNAFHLRGGGAWSDEGRDRRFTSWIRMTNRTSLSDRWREWSTARCSQEVTTSRASGHTILTDSDPAAEVDGEASRRGWASTSKSPVASSNETVSMPIDSDCLTFPSVSQSVVDLPKHDADICMGTLVMEGRATLKNTIGSWNASGLYALVRERAALLQGPCHPIWTPWARALVESHGFHVLLATRQLFHSAFVRIAKWCTSPAVLLVEEDFAVSHHTTGALMRQQLAAAARLLATERVAVVRMRHLLDDDQQNYAVTYFKRRAAHHGLGDALMLPFDKSPDPDCYVELARRSGREPSDFVPHCSVFRCMEKPRMYCMRTSAHDEWYPAGPSRWTPFSTQAAMWPRRWFLDSFTATAKAVATAPRGSRAWALPAAAAVIRNRTAAAQTIAKIDQLQFFETVSGASDAWVNGGRVVARGDGIFTHVRLDRSRCIREEDTSGDERALGLCD